MQGALSHPAPAFTSGSNQPLRWSFSESGFPPTEPSLIVFDVVTEGLRVLSNSVAKGASPGGHWPCGQDGDTVYTRAGMGNQGMEAWLGLGAGAEGRWAHLHRQYEQRQQAAAHPPWRLAWHQSSHGHCHCRLSGVGRPGWPRRAGPCHPPEWQPAGAGRVRRGH